MPKLTKSSLEKTLTKRLALKEPRFKLEKLAGGRLSGSVISDYFSGMKYLERQRKLWAALDAEYGPESVQLVGTLLAYTDEEWDMDLQGDPAPCPAKKTSNGKKSLT